MKYFLMSVKFNKQTPKDFGLEYKDGRYICTKDGTEWEPCQLYDLGWGNENGFYKKPLPSFTKLMELVINDTDEEDSLGAAAIIEQFYVEELKMFLLDCMTKKTEKSLKMKLNNIFQLYNAANKTLCKGMYLSESKQDHNCWKIIADFYST